MTSYLRAQTRDGPSYLKEGCLDKLRRVDAVVFDCDGVLIDVRNSYLQTIEATIRYFLRRVVDLEVPVDGTLPQAIHLLKKSGGFNSDWNGTYALLLFLFNRLPSLFSARLASAVATEAFARSDLSARFALVENHLRSIRPIRFTAAWSELHLDLVRYAARTDDTGPSSAEQLIAEDAKGTGDLATFKAFLSYPDDGGQSLLATVFDEIFYGPTLFEAHNGAPPRFHTEHGLVEDETLIITDETLQTLQRLLGPRRLGIVSGRDSLTARHTMGALLPRFHSEATLFLMDYADSDEKEALRKPNPLPLLRSSAALEPFTYALYVGDSAEDILMARNANRVTPRFISVGVYSLSDYPDELIAYLREAETDVIVPSVNHLPSIIRDARRNTL